jgi:SOS response regulatory protein OraA/RecX
MSKMSALDKIASFLARRDYSSYELEQRLKRAKYDLEEIREALEVARDKRWILPPEELAKKVAKSLHRKGKSTRYISMYLKKLKLPAVNADKEEEIKKALELVLKRLKIQAPFSYEQKQKILQFLRNRSYDEACIRKVIHHEIS